MILEPSIKIIRAQTGPGMAYARISRNSLLTFAPRHKGVPCVDNRVKGYTSQSANRHHVSTDLLNRSLKHSSHSRMHGATRADENSPGRGPFEVVCCSRERFIHHAIRLLPSVLGLP